MTKLTLSITDEAGAVLMSETLHKRHVEGVISIAFIRAQICDTTLAQMLNLRRCAVCGEWWPASEFDVEGDKQNDKCGACRAEIKR